MTGTGLSAPFTFKGGSYPGTGGSCTSTLNAAAACTIVVRWAPTATGIQSGTFNIGYNNGASVQSASGNVQGTGAAPANLTISDGPTYNYGSFATGTNNDKSFTITNSGGVAASAISGSGLSAPFAFKGGTFPGTGGSCTATLAASTACSIVVTYSPTVAGTQSSQIDISYNDGVTTMSTSRAVQGTGLLPANISISDGTTYSYGTKANGSSTDKSFTLTNTGSFTATAMVGSGLSAPYTFKGGSYPGTGGSCSTTLASGGTCTVIVTFSPASSGTYNGQFDIGYNNGVTGQTSSRTVTGIGAPPRPTQSATRSRTISEQERRVLRQTKRLRSQTQVAWMRSR